MGAVEVLRQAWVQQYWYDESGQLRWREAKLSRARKAGKERRGGAAAPRRLMMRSLLECRGRAWRSCRRTIRRPGSATSRASGGRISAGCAMPTPTCIDPLLNAVGVPGAVELDAGAGGVRTGPVPALPVRGHVPHPSAVRPGLHRPGLHGHVHRGAVQLLGVAAAGVHAGGVPDPGRRHHHALFDPGWFGQPNCS